MTNKKTIVSWAEDAGGFGALKPVLRALSSHFRVCFATREGSVASGKLDELELPKGQVLVTDSGVASVLETFRGAKMILTSMCGGNGPELIEMGNHRGILTTTVECVFGERYAAYAKSPPRIFFAGGEASLPLLMKSWRRWGGINHTFGFPALDGLTRSLAKLDGEAISRRHIEPGHILVHISGGKYKVAEMVRPIMEGLDDDRLVFSMSIHPGATDDEKSRAGDVFSSFRKGRTVLPEEVVDFMDPFAMGKRCVLIAPVASGMLVQKAVAGGQAIAWAGEVETGDLTKVTGITDPSKFPPIAGAHIALARDAQSLQDAFDQELVPFCHDGNAVQKIVEVIMGETAEATASA